MTRIGTSTSFFVVFRVGSWFSYFTFILCKWDMFTRVRNTAAIILLLACSTLSAQVVTSTDDPRSSASSPKTGRSILGVKLRPEVAAMVAEIEKKCGKELYAEFTEQEDFMLAQSFVDENRLPVVLVDPQFARQTEKLEAILIHELLHLVLRVNNYPVFIFSPTVKTQRGPAIDTEQGNINDLKNLIEHRIFKADMVRYGVDKLLDLSGDTARIARQNKGREGNNADIINYIRAILEYLDPKDVAEVAKIYSANGWTRDLKVGKEIADIIAGSNIKTPTEYEAVFLRCLLKLYPLPARVTFKLTLDRKNKIFRQMIISAGRVAAVKKPVRRN